MVSDFPPPDDPLVRLCADARLLLQYLDFAPIRVENAYRLELALYSARDVGVADDRWKESVLNLRMEVEAACERLEPIISIADLRAGRSPFAENNGRFEHPLKLFLVALAITITFLCVKSFMMMNEYAMKVVELNEIRATKPLETLYKLRRQFDSGVVRDSQSTATFEFKRSIDEVRRAFALFEDVSEYVSSDHFDDYFLWAAFKKLIVHNDDLVTNNSQPAATPTSGSNGRGVDNLAVAPPSIGPDSRAKPQDHASDDENFAYAERNCIKFSERKGQLLPPEQLTGEYLKLLVAEVPCFMDQLGIRTTGFQEVYIDKFEKLLKEQIYLMNMIQLPLIAGTLGGLIYLIHFMIYRRHFPAKNAYDIAFNILTSGLFGILIGWVLSLVQMGGKASEVISASPFGLAFLAGFSSDFFFQAIGKLAQGRRAAEKRT